MNPSCCYTHYTSSHNTEETIPCQISQFGKLGTTLPAEPTPLELDWADAYSACYDAMPTHPLGFSFANIWAWQDWCGLTLHFRDGLAWLQCQRLEARYLAPVGPWEDIDWLELQPVLLRMGTIHQVPEPLASIWQSALTCSLEITPTRDSWEYIYATQDLAELSGNRYHMQRNHVNAYVRMHGEPDIRKLGIADIPAILHLAEDWYKGHEMTPTRTAELVSLQRVCNAWQKLHLVAEGVCLDNQLVAFSIGCRLDDEIMGVLYEKAEPGLRGSFPMMTRSFARTAGRGFSRLNRAEDMGDEGMRNAKTLLRPVAFQKMYTVRLEAD